MTLRALYAITGLQNIILNRKTVLQHDIFERKKAKQSPEKIPSHKSYKAKTRGPHHLRCLKMSLDLDKHLETIRHALLSSVKMLNQIRYKLSRDSIDTRVDPQ